MSRSWMIGTPLPAPLEAEVRGVVAMLRAGDAAPRERNDRTAAVIVALGETALTHHFVGPLERIGVGLVARKTVDVAIRAVVRGIGTPVRSVIRGLDDDAFPGIADELEQILYPDPHG